MVAPNNKNEINPLFTLIAIVIMIFLAVGSCSKNDGSSGSSSHIEINKQYHTTSGAVGFASKDSLEKYFQYYQQNDGAAAKSYLLSHMAAGDAVMFSGGETVIVSDISSWSGMAKVRRAGNYSEYWVYSVWLE